MGIDEKAFEPLIQKLVDPWHKTFARDVVEMYEANRNKQSDYMPPQTEEAASSFMHEGQNHVCLFYGSLDGRCLKCGQPSKTSEKK